MIELWLLLLCIISAIDCCYNPWEGMCQVNCINEKLFSFEDCTSDVLIKGVWDESLVDDSIILDKSGIITVPDKAFVGFKLGELIFSNTFTNFAQKAFQGLEVNTIAIHNNTQLKYLPAGLFQGLSMLRYLYITGNPNLKCLPDNLFVGLHGLKDLYLQGNNIKSFTPNVFQGLVGADFITYIYIGQAHGKAVGGICAQTFRDIHAKVRNDDDTKYPHPVHKCVVECGSKVEGLTVINSTETCNCNSMEGCVTEQCRDPVTVEPNPEPTPTNSAIRDLILTCLLAILVPLHMLINIRRS